jgi:hypothetical protein
MIHMGMGQKNPGQVDRSMWATSNIKAEIEGGQLNAGFDPAYASGADWNASKLHDRRRHFFNITLQQ